MLNNESRPRPSRPQRDINLTALETLPPNMFPVAGVFFLRQAAPLELMKQGECAVVYPPAHRI